MRGLAFVEHITALLHKTLPRKKSDMARAQNPEMHALRVFLAHAGRFENFDPRPVQSARLSEVTQAAAPRATPNTYSALPPKMQSIRLGAEPIRDDLDGQGTSTHRPGLSRPRSDFSIVPVPLPQDTETRIVEGYALAIRIINTTQMSDIFPEDSESERFERVREVSRLINPRNLKLEGLPHIAETGERALNIVKGWILPQSAPRPSRRQDS